MQNIFLRSRNKIWVWVNQVHKIVIFFTPFSSNLKSTMKWIEVKGMVHFEINFWYVLAYLKAIQDVGVFVSTVFSILMFFSQIVVV